MPAIASTLPEPVRRLLHEHVESFEHLETLLLLAREPGRRVTAEAAARELGLAEAAAEAALEHLQGHGLLLREAGSPPAWRLQSARPDLAADVAALAQACATSRVAVMEQLSANAIDRMRTSALRIFAEAFRLKGRSKDG